MASQAINTVALWGKDITTGDCDYYLQPGISTDPNNAAVADAVGNLFVPAVNLQQELFGVGEVLPTTATNSVDVVLTDGSTVTLAPGDTVPANISGCIAFDEVSGKLAYIGVDTNTFGVPSVAVAAGTDFFGDAYLAGANIVTYPGNLVVAQPVVPTDTVAPATVAGISTNGVAYAIGDVIVTQTDGTVYYEAPICDQMGPVPASITQLCFV